MLCGMWEYVLCVAVDRRDAEDERLSKGSVSNIQLEVYPLNEHEMVFVFKIL